MLAEVYFGYIRTLSHNNLCKVNHLDWGGDEFAE